MINCPKCKSVVISAVRGICDNCGALLSGNVPDNNNLDDNDDLEFVVMETSTPTPEFVGGTKKFSDDDQLELASTSDLMESEAERNSKKHPENNKLTFNKDYIPIGTPEPSLPELFNDNKQIASEDAEESADTDEIVLPPVPPTFKKLSADEVKSIESDMNISHNYLSDEEKIELLSKIKNIPDSNKTEEKSSDIRKDDSHDTSKKSIVSEQPQSDLPAPKMAERSKGAASFYKNFIKLLGTQELHNGDEFVINDREYVLRPHKFNKNLILGSVVGVAVVILIVIGSLFISDAGTGQGQVIGMVVDDNGLPMIQGADIRFPEDNLTVKSNPRGFFQTDDLPIGTHKIEYLFKGQIIKTDYITVTDGEISTILLEPDKIETIAPTEQISTTSPVQNEPAQTETKNSVLTSNTSSQKFNKTPDNTPGKITLAANVQSAKFVLDGTVMGAGNLTYAKIKPGKHNYLVSADGYQEAAGAFSLLPGEEKTLKIAMTPLEFSEKTVQFDAEDFYYSGVTALKEKDYESAVNDLSQAIELNPSYADAVISRGDAYRKLNDISNAFNDYIRAAETYAFKGNYNSAFTAYNKAIETDKNNINAYIGRGNLFLNKGEGIAAVADFENAININKNNFDANYGLGVARFKQGNYKQAVKYFKKAKDINKDNPLVYQYLMLSYLKDDEIKDVKKTFEKFREIASEKQLEEFANDSKFSAVIEAINKE